MSENLYAVSRAEWIILLQAQKARMLLGVCIANVHTGFLMETRTLSEIGLQATPRQEKKKNLSTFCPRPETSGGRLSLKVLDKLEAKEKQPSFQNRFFILCFLLLFEIFLQ